MSCIVPGGMSYRTGALALAVLACCAPASFADDYTIIGVQAAAAEMPHTAVLLRRPEPGVAPDQIIPLHKLTYSPILDAEREEYAFEAYLDTGTSGVLISREFYEFLDVQQQLDSNNQPVTFHDITVDGTKAFHVSEPLYVSIGPMPLFNEPEYDDLPAINQIFTAPTLVRAQLATDYVDTGPLSPPPRNVVGMPALMDKVMLVDSTRYNVFDPESEELPYVQTQIFNSGATGLPQHDYTVRFSTVDFSGFTVTEPDEPGVEPPTLAHNPIIGRDPLATPSAGDPPGVTIARTLSGGNRVSSEGNWLFDTGAQISFVASHQAAVLGYEMKDIFGIGEPLLVDTFNNDAIVEDAFLVPISGADPGSITLLWGFTLPELRLPAVEGDIIYYDVPILIADIVVDDGQGNSFILDGDIGMNLFLPTHTIEGDLLTGSGFDFMAFDEAARELRLTVTVPEPTMLATLGAVPFMLLRRRRAHALAA